MKNYETVSILMIDDDPIDVKMFERTLRRNRITNPLYSAKNGEEGLEILHSRQVTKPMIIILDLNMPRMNGIEFLSELRKDDALQDSLVFVMTTSDADADKVEAYNFNVAGYMVKSEIGENFLDAIDLLEQYWKTIQLPA